MSEITDTQLLETYMSGFRDELDGKAQNNYTFPDSIIQSAYDMGRADCIAGDDCPSLDYQSDEDILKRIKK